MNCLITSLLSCLVIYIILAGACLILISRWLRNAPYDPAEKVIDQEPTP